MPPTITSSVVPFSYYLRSFPASGSFLIIRLCASGGQSIGASVQHQSFNEYSGLISFMIHRFDLHTVQGILKSLLQHHRLKSLILSCSAFYMVHLSHPYLTSGKTAAWTLWTFVGKVMSLFLFFFFFIFSYFIIIISLYNIVLVLPYINMHPPRVYTCSPP